MMSNIINFTDYKYNKDIVMKALEMKNIVDGYCESCMPVCIDMTSVWLDYLEAKND